MSGRECVSEALAPGIHVGVMERIERVGASAKSHRSDRLRFGVGDPYTEPQFGAAALVIIDTQRDLLDDGALPIAGTSARLPNMRVLLDAFRAAERPIVHIIRIYEPNGSDADLCRRELLGEGAAVLLRD